MLDLLLAMALLQTYPAQCNAVPASGAQTRCPQWRLIGRDPEGDFFIDPSSIYRRGHSFDVWERVIFPRALNGVRSAQSRSRYDCRARTSTLLSVIFYDARGAVAREGTVMMPDERVATPSPPGSTYGMVLARYCQR